MGRCKRIRYPRAGAPEVGHYWELTPAERRDPSLLNGSRRKRIAKGSGSGVDDVNRLLKQFVQARKLMKQLGGGGEKAMKKLAARMPQLR